MEIAGAVTIAAGTTLNVPGTLTLTSGTLTTGTLAAQGNINIATAFTGGTTTLLINGTTPQTLQGFQSSLAGGLPNVDINKTSGLMTISGTLRTGRNWTVTNATAGLLVTGSTLVFTGASATTITGSHTLNNVEIRGNTISIAAGTTLIVAGSTDLFSGTLNQIGATGTLAAQGDVFARIGFTGGGTATLLMNGTVPQTLTGFHTALVGAMPNVNIAKPSGTLTIAGTIRTGRNWTYTSGGLAVGGSTVVFNGTLTITGTHALNNVEMRTGDVTVAAGDTLAVGGLLTMTDGNLIAGTVDALGDIVLGVGYDGEGGTYRIAGTTDQTFTGFADTLNTDMANLVIDKPSGTLHLVGTFRMLTSSWTWLMGTVDAGTSTVYFDTTVTITGTHSLNNVYLTGGPHIVTGGTTLTALGTLTLDNGTIDGGTIAGAGPISQLSTFDGGTGTLAITGGSNHTLTGSATIAAGNLPAVQINTSGGTLTMAGTIRTANDWTYIGGVVDPDGSLVVFAGNLTVDSGGMSFNDVLVNAGIATLASNLTVAGDLTVAAGTLAIGSNSVFVAGDVTINAGLTVTTGTLDLNGLTGQILGGSAAIGLYNLSINDPAGVTQTTTVAVAGTLDLSGAYIFNGQSLSIANAITGTPNNLAGDATSTLIINGAGSGIVIPSSLATLLNLTITNANGAALAGPLSVAGTLTLSGGNVNTTGNLLSIGPAGGVVRTSGHVIGRLRKWAPLGSGVSLTFEIGDASAYAPMSLTFGTVSVSGQLTGSTTPGEHPSIASSPIDPAQDVNRWWSLTNAGVAFDTLAITFTWVPADVDAGANTSQFIVGKWDGSWVAPIAGANTATTITALGLTSLSEFAVGEAAADLSISKGAPAFATAGDPAGFDYTLTVHNAGPADNLTGFTLSDTLPAGLTFQSLGSDARCAALGQVVTCTNGVGLANGGDDVFVVHVTLASTVDAGTLLSNTAVVATSGTNDPDPANNTDTALSTVAEDVQLSLSKVFSTATITAGGAGGSFTITVTNAGASDADNLVVTDLVDARLTVDAVAGGAFDCSFGSGQAVDCRIAHLAAGASLSITVSYHVLASVASATVSNQADATSDEDGALGSDSVDIITSADLSISKGAPAFATAGDPAGFDYTLTVHNAGPADNLTGFTLSDTLPAGLTFQSLGSDARCAALGQVVTCTNGVGLANGGDDVFVVHVTLASTVDAGTLLSNTAVVATSGTNDPDPANNTDTALSTVAEDVQLSLSKVFSTATITAGGAGGSFTITVTNAGASDADNLVVTDLVDARLTVDAVAGGAFDCSFGSGQAVDCRIAHLAAGASLSITVSYHVLASVASATVSNQADATSDEDGALGSDSVDIITSADIADIKVASPDPVLAGMTLTYTITITNLGPSDALSVTLSDALDAALTGATYCIDLGSGCGPSSVWTGSVNVGTIAAGASVDVVISATVDPGTPDGTIIANTASASATTPDPNGVNNASSATSAVVGLPTPTPTPTPIPTATASGSVPDTSSLPLVGGLAPLMLLIALACWIALLTGLAVEGSRRRPFRG